MKAVSVHDTPWRLNGETYQRIKRKLSEIGKGSKRNIMKSGRVFDWTIYYARRHTSSHK